MRTFREYVRALCENEQWVTDPDFSHSDMQSFKELLHMGEVKDGLNVVEPYVFMVKDGKANLLKDLDAQYDYKSNAYRIVPRELPPPAIEDRIYVHATDASIPGPSDLRPGKSYGNFGQNEYNAIYLAQDNTHHSRYSSPGKEYMWGKNAHRAKLMPGTKIAKTNQEVRAAWAKHPEMSKQEALEAEGYDGVAKIDERGDVWELALFKNRLVPV